MAPGPCSRETAGLTWSESESLAELFRTAPSRSLTLPHGRATEHADAQVSSPRVSKGCAQPNDLRDFDGALSKLYERMT